MLDQPAAHDRTDAGGDRGESRPGADGLPTPRFIEGRADDGEASGTSSAPRDALNGARDDQLTDVLRRGRSRSTRARRERRRQKDAPSAEAIAQRTADQQQRGEK